MRRGRSTSAGVVRIAVAAMLAAGCAPDAEPHALCGPPRWLAALPPDVAESSGIAASRRHRGIFWTHNDSDNGATLYAVDSSGAILARVRATGTRNRDWEDLALGPCPAGDCLYIADTGDNRGERDDIVIYRVPEPAPGDTATAPAERFPLRFPGTPLDTEALYVLPDGRLFLISKGRNAPVTVFAYPGTLRAGERVELRRVARLTYGPVGLPDQVTGAAASPDGRWIAVRTYTAVQFYRMGWRDRLRPALEGAGLNLQALAEPQGEAVTLTGDGGVILTSEAADGGEPGFITRLDCRLE